MMFNKHDDCDGGDDDDGHRSVIAILSHTLYVYYYIAQIEIFVVFLFFFFLRLFLV